MTTVLASIVCSMALLGRAYFKGESTLVSLENIKIQVSE
jgi:hypothetical protein